MKTRRKHILIIGAGASGMVAAKACHEQDLDVTVYEQTSLTGGWWRWREHTAGDEHIPTVMKQMVMNTSKELNALSDHAAPRKFPNFMDHKQMVTYLDWYSNVFQFKSMVKLNHKVIRLEPAMDHSTTGRWTATARRTTDGQLVVNAFDGVMICTGHYNQLNPLPVYPNRDGFDGKVMHLHELNDVEHYQDKVVVVVGSNNEAIEATVALSRVAKRVYLVPKEGVWIAPKRGKLGLPFDHHYHQRFWSSIRGWLSLESMSNHLEKQVNDRLDHRLYQLEPNHRIVCQPQVMNEDLANCILQGSVIVKPEIDQFCEDGVLFHEHHRSTACDVVLFATGYSFSCPFVSEKILRRSEDGEVRGLFRHQFIASLAQAHTLAFISLIQTDGVVLSIGELQARWFAMINAGKLELPTKEKMMKEIETRKNGRKVDGKAHWVEWQPCMDELAKEIGCFPPLWRLWFHDPELFKAIMFGPPAPYLYRLVGPNRWLGARRAMLSIDERSRVPFLTKLDFP